MKGITASNAGGAVHNQGYSFDTIGNVIQRQDFTQGVTENFAYDTLNRLFSSSGTVVTRSFNYDRIGNTAYAIGNITYKSDVGTYTYPAPTAALPHAVKSVDGAGNPNTVTATYGYDPNGNLYTAAGTFYLASGSVSFSRTLAYMSFNMPSLLTHVQGSASYSYTYTYNSEHERVKLVTVRPSDSLITIYVHPAGKGTLLYEKEIHCPTSNPCAEAGAAYIEYKHYVNGSAGLIGAFVTKSTYVAPDGPQMRYYLRDYVGSIAAIANPAAAPMERLGYEAYGERRYVDGTAENRGSPIIGVATDRGFTTHEHLDEMMLIHMNGRIYDPILARFTTADRSVANSADLQTLNRYTYARNNPLRFLDPTGYATEIIRKQEDAGGSGEGGGGEGGGGAEGGGGEGGGTGGGEGGSFDFQDCVDGPGRVCITGRRWLDKLTPNDFILFSPRPFLRDGGGGGGGGERQQKEQKQQNPQQPQQRVPCDQSSATPSPPGLSTGVAIHGGLLLNPITSGGGFGVGGLNWQSVPGSSSTFTGYDYLGTGDGVDVGGSIQSVWAWGSGSWTGTFKSFNVSGGLFTLSVFWTPGAGGYVGGSGGLGIGLPGFSYQETIYTCRQ
jgi:RHS repeat-associated protein